MPKTSTTVKARNPKVIMEFNDTLGNDQFVGIGENGLLVCSCLEYLKVMPNRLAWCIHVEACYKKHLDAFVFYDAPEEMKPAKKFIMGNVAVPFLRNPPVVVQCVIPQPDEDDLAAVYINTDGTFRQGNHNHLGWLMPGMGRWAIRSLIVEWLIENSIKLEPKCSAPQHFAPLDYIFDERNTTHLADHFWRVTTGVCLWCRENDGVPDL